MLGEKMQPSENITQRIESLEKHVRRLERRLDAFNLQVPLKYRKAFVKDDEIELFTLGKYKPQYPTVKELTLHSDYLYELEMPKDLEEYKKALERMKKCGEEMSNIYRPPNYDGPGAIEATIGVKFCDDIFLLKSFLDAKGIEYKEEELEDGPYGKGLRIKKEKNTP
jgi:hypothetical protein